MSFKTDNIFYDDIYIQRGVRKSYFDSSVADEYVLEYSLNINDRDNYCIDSRGVDSFFYVFKEEDKYELIEIDKCRDFSRNIKKANLSLDELNRGYIRLSEFIKDAEYVGREFKRTSPVITYCGDFFMKDNNYFDKNDFDNNKYIVLYMKNNTCLVKYICSYGSGYCIIDCRYIQDGNYKFVGKIYEEFTDRLEVFFDILKYINKMEYNDVKKRIRC